MKLTLEGNLLNVEYASPPKANREFVIPSEVDFNICIAPETTIHLARKSGVYYIIDAWCNEVWTIKEKQLEGGYIL